jgi:hypothetical protein
MSTPETPTSSLPPPEPPTRFRPFRSGKRSPALFATAFGCLRYWRGCHGRVPASPSPFFGDADARPDHVHARLERGCCEGSSRGDLRQQIHRSGRQWARSRRDRPPRRKRPTRRQVRERNRSGPFRARVHSCPGNLALRWPQRFRGASGTAAATPGRTPSPARPGWSRDPGRPLK